MDDLHKGANGQSIVDKLEDILREQFIERERKWDEQDIRRHELRMKHKERILKRLELQRRAGQMYTAEQVELATATATSQHMLPAIIRRSLRNGEYAYHGKNCSVQELRHCSCKLSSRLLEEARECTHKPVPSWELDKLTPTGHGLCMSQPPATGKRYTALNIDGLPAEERSVSGPVPRSQSRAAFTTLISAKDKPLENKENHSLTSMSQYNNSKIDMLSGLSMQLFNPDDMRHLLETEKQDGTGRRLEESLPFKSTLERSAVSLSGTQLRTSHRSISAISPDSPIRSMPISFFDSLPVVQPSPLSAGSKAPSTAYFELESVGPITHTTIMGELNSKSADTDAQASSLPAPTISTFTFHENHEYYKNPYLVTCAPISKASSTRNAASKPTQVITKESINLKPFAVEQSHPSELKLETTISLPQVLRCNRLAQKVEPLGLATIEPIVFVSDTANVLTEAFQYPFKHPKRDKPRGARVQFAEQTLFKVGVNDDRIAETCDSDSDDYIMCSKQKSNLQHRLINSIDNENESLDSKMDFSGTSSCKTLGSQCGLLDDVSVNISLIHKSGGANLKRSGTVDSPSALIKEFEEKHFMHINGKNINP
ncbi:Hypothetical protein GLP15_706 [Giardia lamblia P15]|uniref:Uncharacterized protein n=1 Tax=Giardia intestinalis (strain P15) TaxID=658858 RepID=E1F3Y0_GIAIA|nr:Hypothetical protein GLP15_706 [Giardia lamblia P15]